MNHRAARTVALLVAALLAGAAPADPQPTSAEVLAAAAASDWRAPDPDHTLYLELASGRVVIELAPAFAPHHVVNIKALAREKYFDGLAIIRVQDNYVVQWGDPDGRREIHGALRSMAPEFFRKWKEDLPFAKLGDGDVYAPEVGHSGGFPAARDRKKGQAWLAHCYGMLGVGRDDAADSGGGTELYVVIGHAPRHLDRNVTLAGRVLRGMELLSSLPRGSGALGFYEKAEQPVPIRAVRIAADLPPAERTGLQVLGTDTPTWQAWVASRRSRREQWFIEATGKVELCNVPIPVRDAPSK